MNSLGDSCRRSSWGTLPLSLSLSSETLVNDPLKEISSKTLANHSYCRFSGLLSWSSRDSLQVPANDSLEELLMTLAASCCQGSSIELTFSHSCEWFLSEDSWWLFTVKDYSYELMSHSLVRDSCQGFSLITICERSCLGTLQKFSSKIFAKELSLRTLARVRGCYF